MRKDLRFVDFVWMAFPGLFAQNLIKVSNLTPVLLELTYDELDPILDSQELRLN